MPRIDTGRSQLDVTVTGSGEPVLLIHGSIVAPTFDAMVREPAFAGRYRFITYDRMGFRGSSHLLAPYSIADQAADAAAVLRSQRIAKAHVAGHSYGGAIALQLALDHPDLVHSLVLLEPALFAGPEAQAFGAAAAPTIEAYARGDARSAIDGFMLLVGGPNARALADPYMPAGWMDDAYRDAQTFFEVEFPALGDWAAAADLAGKIPVPLLSVLGKESGPLFDEGHAFLQQWFPQTESAVIPGVNHLLQYINPRAIAEPMAAFFARHPIK